MDVATLWHRVGSAAVIGYPNPALSLLVAAVNYALAMFVWMLVLGALKLGCGQQCAVMLAVMLLRLDR